jgi:hypothetical protein
MYLIFKNIILSCEYFLKLGIDLRAVAMLLHVLQKYGLNKILYAYCSVVGSSSRAPEFCSGSVQFEYWPEPKAK